MRICCAVFSDQMSDVRIQKGRKMKKFIHSVEDLEVFQKAYQVYLEIHKLTLLFPKIEQYALGDQLRRSTKSICANLAEGFAKQKDSKREFARYLSLRDRK